MSGLVGTQICWFSHAHAHFFLDPGYCPYGGVDAGNGYCYKLSTTTKNWQDARDDCINSYGGRLANLKDRNIHGNVSSLLTGGIT